jgi:hypothetical protein
MGKTTARTITENQQKEHLYTRIEYFLKYKDDPQSYEALVAISGKHNVFEKSIHKDHL